MAHRRNRIAEAAEILAERRFDAAVQQCRTAAGRLDLARLVPAVRRRLPALTDEEFLKACAVATELLRSDTRFQHLHEASRRT